jgi:hypothetical protein
MYKKLQYISQGNTVENTTFKSLDSGCDWIQLRFKTKTPPTCYWRNSERNLQRL